jgi:hypothetical protein
MPFKKFRCNIDLKISKLMVAFHEKATETGLQRFLCFAAFPPEQILVQHVNSLNQNHIQAATSNKKVTFNRFPADNVCSFTRVTCMQYISWLRTNNRMTDKHISKQVGLIPIRPLCGKLTPSYQAITHTVSV